MSTFNDALEARQNGQAREPVDFLQETGFLDAFFGPVSLDFNGKKIVAVPLSTEDYEPECDALTRTVREQREKRIPPNADNISRWKIQANIDDTEITPDDLIGLVLRTKWTRKIITMALKNAGITDDSEVKAWMKKRPAKANEMLAVVLSGLYTRNRFNQMYVGAMSIPEGGTARPLPEAGEGQQGENSNSGSSAPSDAQQTIRSPA